MNVGDHVRFSVQDCCLEVEVDGVIEALETRAESYARDAPDETPDEPDAIVAVTIGGVKIIHPWGEWDGDEFEYLVDGVWL